MPFQLRSPAFSNDDTIPPRYTADGDNISPPLEWRDPPPGTKSFMLTCEDPDAPSGTFRHWGVFDIPPERKSFPEGMRAEACGVARNDFGHARYDGPAPPRGDGPHHYHFRLAALDVDQLPTKKGAPVEELKRVAEGHIIGETEIVGVYER
jgi:hypothetical protein